MNHHLTVGIVMHYYFNQSNLLHNNLLPPYREWEFDPTDILTYHISCCNILIYFVITRPSLKYNYVEMQLPTRRTKWGTAGWKVKYFKEKAGTQRKIIYLIFLDFATTKKRSDLISPFTLHRDKTWFQTFFLHFIPP